MNKRIYNETSTAITVFPNPFSARAKPTFILMFFQRKLKAIPVETDILMGSIRQL